ncbi:MAG TPA: hypothetical protein VFH43_13470, partial [Candidatus Kapabacteria bacterium]|nr:hypothetical protein [Candidatus Kapabacteria bacterium]
MSLTDAAHSGQHHPLLDQAEATLGTPHRTIELCTEVLKRSREELGEHEFCRAHYLSGFANRLVGELAHAESELFFAKQLATSLDAKPLIANCTMQLALVYVDEQLLDRAIELLSDARTQFAVLGMIGEEAVACYSLSTAYKQLKQDTAAIAHLEEALIKFSDTGSEEGVTAVHCALILFAMDRGNFQEARERAEMCLKVLPAKSLPKNRIFLNLALAESCRQLGEVDRALEI